MLMSCSHDILAAISEAFGFCKHRCVCLYAYREIHKIFYFFENNFLLNLKPTFMPNKKRALHREELG